MSKQEELADVLDEYAEFLDLDGQTGRSHAYERAARSIRTARVIPPDPSRLDNIGESVRGTIAEYQYSGSIDELEELREKYHWFDELGRVDGIGPSRAKDLHETLSVEDVNDLLFVGDDVTILDGVGTKTAEKILESARDVSDE